MRSVIGRSKDSAADLLFAIVERMENIRKPALTLAAALTAFAGTALADQPLFHTEGCFACHAVDKKVFGPPFREVAQKLKPEGTAKAEATIINVIRHGSHGVWGTYTMPPQPQVKPEDAKTLAKWILSL